MLNIAEALKVIYRNDTIPRVAQNVPKDIKIAFPGMDPIYADQVVDDSLSLEEGIVSDKNIKFGTCRASQIKFTLANVPEDLKGKMFTIDQLISGYTVPLGKYKVESAIKQDDDWFKDVIAYDKLKDIDVDVSGWYNGLFPIGNETYTLAQFRSSLLTYLGIEAEVQVLPNDDMRVDKTITPTQISGRAVLEACVELNGAFGHINRIGKFVRIVLEPAYGLYPSEDLLPAEDLYPVDENDTTFTMDGSIAETIDKSMYKQGGVKFEEYTVKEIDKLQIRSEEDDIGAIVGTGSNTYVIEGNFLVFGKSAAELEAIAWNVYGNIVKRPYRPYQSDNIGLPYIEVGDTLRFSTDDPVRGYVLQRTLTGIQALSDENVAEGSEELEQNWGVNKELIQTLGRLTRIRKDVEGVSVEVEDLRSSTATRFTQTDEALTQEATRAIGAEEELSGRIVTTAESIAAEVTRATEAEGNISGSIDVLAGQIILKVDENGNIAAVELGADPAEGTSINLTADNISLEGLITANGNFKILEDGTVETINGKYSGTIEAASIRGSDIFGGEFTSSSWDGNSYGTTFNEIYISGGTLVCRKTTYAINGQTYNSVATFNANSLTTQYAYVDYLGSSANPVDNGYFDDLVADTANIRDLKINGARLYQLFKGGATNTSLAVLFDSSQNFRPSEGGGTVFNLGTSAYAWSTLYIKTIQHSGGNLGFFGAAPATKKSVAQTNSSATLANVITDLNALKTALAGYGLISS